MSITINLTKAKEIKKDMVRAERAPLLEKLDVEVMRNITNAERLAEIEALKQALRDATTDSSIVNAQTVEELKAARPAALDAEV
jgi:hypothetical protein